MYWANFLSWKTMVQTDKQLAKDDVQKCNKVAESRIQQKIESLFFNM